MRFRPNPEVGDLKFWKNTDWTAVIVCNQDMTGDGHGLSALEMHTRSHSEDGRAWTLTNRKGFHIDKIEKGWGRQIIRFEFKFDQQLDFVIQVESTSFAGIILSCFAKFVLKPKYHR